MGRVCPQMLRYWGARGGPRVEVPSPRRMERRLAGQHPWSRWEGLWGQEVPRHVLPAVIFIVPSCSLLSHPKFLGEPWSDVHETLKTGGCQGCCIWGPPDQSPQHRHRLPCFRESPLLSRARALRKCASRAQAGCTTALGGQVAKKRVSPASSVSSRARGNIPPRAFRSRIQHVLREPPRLSGRVFALQGPLVKEDRDGGTAPVGES